VSGLPDLLFIGHTLSMAATHSMSCSWLAVCLDFASLSPSAHLPSSSRVPAVLFLQASDCNWADTRGVKRSHRRYGAWGVDVMLNYSAVQLHGWETSSL
jgi:hypothetical protein